MIAANGGCLVTAPMNVRLTTTTTRGVVGYSDVQPSGHPVRFYSRRWRLNRRGIGKKIVMVVKAFYRTRQRFRKLYSFRKHCIGFDNALEGLPIFRERCRIRHNAMKGLPIFREHCNSLYNFLERCTVSNSIVESYTMPLTDSQSSTMFFTGIFRVFQGYLRYLERYFRISLEHFRSIGNFPRTLSETIQRSKRIPNFSKTLSGIVKCFRKTPNFCQALSVSYSIGIYRGVF